ncbi:MAG: hypothetical protein KDD65_14445, partial [Bacteroidetes bacterium]|nr:hypothetical protein [Bacteroidota bacterium]
GPLTNKHIDMFADAMRSLKAWSDEYTEQGEALSERLKAQGADQTAYLNAYREWWGASGDPRDEVAAIIKKSGFSSMEAYREVSERIMRAYGAIVITDQQGDAQQSMDNIMQGLAANPNLSAEQKAQMQAAVDEAKSRMQEYHDSVPPADRRITERHLPMLKELFGDLGMPTEN